MPSASKISSLAAGKRVTSSLRQSPTVTPFTSTVLVPPVAFCDVQEIVELAPEAAPIRISFAVALACHPPKAKAAEREFLEAIRLDPNNADYHYKFGLYYKTMRERARAIIEMRAALSLNPHHPGARAELTALSPKDPLLSSLSRR